MSSKKKLKPTSNSVIKGANLEVLQNEAEGAARNLKSARTSLATAKLALDRAEEAYSVAQKTFLNGVEQVTSSTKVL